MFFIIISIKLILGGGVGSKGEFKLEHRKAPQHSHDQCPMFPSTYMKAGLWLVKTQNQKKDDQNIIPLVQNSDFLNTRLIKVRLLRFEADFVNLRPRSLYSDVLYIK